jgi:hypothetical protein
MLLHLMILDLEIGGDERVATHEQFAESGYAMFQIMVSDGGKIASGSATQLHDGSSSLYVPPCSSTVDKITCIEDQYGFSRTGTSNRCGDSRQTSTRFPIGILPPIDGRMQVIGMEDGNLRGLRE